MYNRYLRYLIIVIVALLSPAVQAADGPPANLLQLYDLALSTNPIVEGRKASVVQAEAQKDQARSKLLPQASATHWSDCPGTGGNSSFVS